MSELPAIDGVVNFRDLGGLQTRDGRRMRARMLFRSGAMHALTNSGVASLSALGVTAVYDLRSDSERLMRPPRLPSNGSIAHLYHPHDRQTGDLFAALRASGHDARDAQDLMVRIYRKLPFDLVQPYRKLFRRVVDGPLPIIFNCAAGKDRTGVAAALLLHALDVPFEIVLNDYLRSDTAYDAIRQSVSGPGALMSELNPSILEPILRTSRLYLLAAFEEIEARNGSIDLYLSQELDIGDVDLKRMRARLLE
jgi:protein-tyrosine phosphatase